MNEKITVAVIGCGSARSETEALSFAIGYHHARAWLAADQNVVLIGVDPNPDNLAAFGAAFHIPYDRLFLSTEALYETLTPSFVSICTWPPLHAPLTIEAAMRGVRGILCEKPMATDPMHVRAMTQAVQEAGCRLAVAHQRRLEPVFLTAKKLIDDGALGEGLAFEGRVSGNWDLLSWTTHWFDMANYLFGSDPISLLAGIDSLGNRRYGHAVEESCVVSVRYPNGNSALCVNGEDITETGVFVRGSKGLLKIDHALTLFEAAGVHQIDPVPVRWPGFVGAARELIDSVALGTPMTCDASQCAAATLMAFAAQESARTNRRVSFPIAFDHAPLEVVQHGTSAPIEH